MVAAGGIDPDDVTIGMLPLLVELAPRLAAVVGDANPDVGGVDALVVVRIDENLAVVLRARCGVIVGLLPRRSAVFRHKEAARFAGRFNGGVYDSRIVRRKRQ